MDQYEELAADMAEVLAELGAPATLTHPVLTFNKQTGKRTSLASSVTQTLAIIGEQEVLDENSGRYVVRTIATLRDKPEPQDTLTMGGRSWTVGKVTTVQPTNTPVIHFAEVEND